MSAAKKATTVAAPAKTAPVTKGKVFEAKNYEKPGLSVDQILEVRQAFELFDTDGTGSIDTKGTPAPMKNSRQRWSRLVSTRKTRWCSR